MRLKNLIKENQIILEAASADASKLRKLEDSRVKLATELEKIDTELQQLRMKISKEVMVTKQGKKTIYKRNSDGIEWYSPDSYSKMYWKIGDKFTDKVIKHDNPEYNNGLLMFPQHERKIALAVYAGPIPKNK